MELERWSNFFVAEVGAAAALAGLLFVSISINLARILQFPALPTRAAEALLTLTSVLVVATFGLVPQSASAFGVEVACVGALAWFGQTRFLISKWGLTREHRRGNVAPVMMNQLPSLSFVAGGVLVMASEPVGLYGVVAGTVLSFVAGIIGAWILMIEIQR